MKKIAVVKFLSLITIMFFAGNVVLNAQDFKKHEIKPFYSTAYPGDISDMFSFGIVNAITGNGKMETTSLGMIGLGYRYQMNKRLRLGIDLGFSPAKEKVYKTENSTEPTKKTDILRMMVMPSLDYSYWKNDWINLYGSVGAGLMYTNRKEKGENNTLNIYDFSYQINPIGIRVGNKSIGAFVEAGYGHKGLITTGISLNF